MRILILLLVCCSFAMVSCTTQNKIVYNYLEDMKDTTTRQSFYVAEPLIQKNDQLSIQIYSASLDPQTDALYNLQTQSNTSGQYGQLMGYLVDQEGNVEIPRLGTIHAAGLTKTQLS